ncbi:MAG TPA: hypothetical protein VF676_13375 [Flavobacterium sp.]|jgi:hypothetical protein
MDTNKRTSADDQEINLSDISRKVGNVFQNLNTAIFRGIRFVVKNAVILLILLALGVGIGLYLDKTQQTYDHQIVVTPNFNSVDYLYSKVELIEAKIKERDFAFLRKIGIQDPEKLSKIEVEPVVDIYGFINRSEYNFQIFKLMAEDGDIKKIIEDRPTSKNYPYHMISYSTKSRTNVDKTVKPLLAFLNNSEFYRKVQKEYVNNVHMKMRANEQTIMQINGILNELAMTEGSGGKSSNLVYINENTQLNDVLKTKDRLVDEQGNRRIELVSVDRIIKDNSVTTNIENTKAVNGKLKLVLPLLFIGLFVLFGIFRSFYRSESAKAANRTL